MILHRPAERLCRFARVALTIALAALLGGSLTFAGDKASNSENPSVPIEAEKPTPKAQRVEIPVDEAAFSEGWTKSISLPETSFGPGGSYELSVRDGWLHARRVNSEGETDWAVMLAEVKKGEVPKITVIRRVPVFELSYGNGRYHIRETHWALRVVRQRSDDAELPRIASLLGDDAESKGYGTARAPKRTLSHWNDAGWCYVASGPDKEHCDCLVRLNPVAKRSPGYGVQCIVGGFGYYFHGDTWLMDDGEILVASRTPEIQYKIELARKKLRETITGSTPPAIEAEQWLNAAGELSWDDLKGKVVLLDFWGTWCTPCVKKMPEVQAMADEYADEGLVVIGVHSAQSAEQCEAFLQEKEYTFPVAIDSGKTSDRYAISAWPTYFLIGKSGKVIVGYVSNPPSREQIEQALEK